MGRKGIPTLAQKFPPIKGKCANCKKPLPKYRQRWCSDECAQDAYLQTDPNVMRSAVEARDHGICALCGHDTGKCQRILDYLNKTARAGGYWEGPGFSKYITFSDQAMFLAAVRFLLEVWGRSQFDRHLWEGDHTVPLAEGGPHLLSNMRTLCIVCHKIQTKLLAARLAAARKAKKELDKKAKKS